MTFGEALYKDIEQNEYLNELYNNLLHNYSISILGTDEKEKELNIEDLLRFADILSKSCHHSNADKHKVWGQEIASVVKALYPNEIMVDYYLNSILSYNGNFRGLDLLNYELFNDGFLSDIYNEYSKNLLEIPSDKTKHFFKAQKKIYNHFEDKFFSFSGPTSLGKSFMMRMFIKDKIIKNAENNFAIIVPSKALINEITSNLINDLQGLLYEKNYRIVTSAGSVALEQEHNYILVLTPERLLYTFIRYNKLKLDYIFIDEAHKISEKNSRSAFYYKIVDMVMQKSNDTKIFFASPNIPNPEVFLRLLSQNNVNSLSSSYSPVSQIKYLLDYHDNSFYLYNDKKSTFSTVQNNLSFNELLLKLFNKNTNTIVYVNSKDKAMSMAQAFASNFVDIQDKELEDFSKEISSSIHQDYFLAELVKKGVGFHIGYLPSQIRQKLESLYKQKKIKTMFCTSTLVEGVNLPADNLFITTYKRGTKKFTAVDFKNLTGRVGRIEYNLYGHVFFVRLEQNVSKNTFESLIRQDVPKQQLSLVTELDFIDKKLIIDHLLQGITQIPKEKTSSEKYGLTRKFALILLRDIMKKRNSLVKQHFSDVLNNEEENKIREIFNQKEAKPDDDINTSVDQTNSLLVEIRNGLAYPTINNNGLANYEDVLDFLKKLRKIFKWDVYEEEFAKENTLRWYATLLCQWIEGKGLQNLTTSAIQNAIERMENVNPKKVRVNGRTEYFDNSQLHRNLIIGETLQAIENVLLFTFANYFLKFSECYKKVHNIKDIKNDWYEYVEYGTTNLLSITLQKYGFSRESSLYIKQNKNEYVIKDNGAIKLKKSILLDSKNSIKQEIQEVIYNAPELFVD